jgi:hypothetical protein
LIIYLPPHTHFIGGHKGSHEQQRGLFDDQQCLSFISQSKQKGRE